MLELMKWNNDDIIHDPLHIYISVGIHISGVELA
jgi:hypothetical protein